MKTKLDEKSKVVAYEVYAIQALYYTGEEYEKNENWTTYGWTLYSKVPKGDMTGLFIHTDIGKYFYKHKDKPAHHYGERFWHDTPAFMTKETAVACMNAIKEGNWHGGRDLRVVKRSMIETLIVVA